MWSYAETSWATVVDLATMVRWEQDKHQHQVKTVGKTEASFVSRDPRMWPSQDLKLIDWSNTLHDVSVHLNISKTLRIEESMITVSVLKLQQTRDLESYQNRKVEKEVYGWRVEDSSVLETKEVKVSSRNVKNALPQPEKAKKKKNQRVQKMVI